MDLGIMASLYWLIVKGSRLRGEFGEKGIIVISVSRRWNAWQESRTQPGCTEGRCVWTEVRLRVGHRYQKKGGEESPPKQILFSKSRTMKEFPKPQKGLI